MDNLNNYKICFYNNPRTLEAMNTGGPNSLKQYYCCQFQVSSFIKHVFKSLV